jgi:hypothetical protein
MAAAGLSPAVTAPEDATHGAGEAQEAGGEHVEAAGDH